MGEPYIVSAIAHFHTAYPAVTNFLPILVWNGYSQEHHSMVSLKTNEQMQAYWQGNGFDEVVLVDAKDFDDQNQPGDYVDSTAFSFQKRLAFTQAVLSGVDKAARFALGGKLTVFIIKQLKGAGVHARGASLLNNSKVQESTRGVQNLTTSILKIRPRAGCKISQPLS